MYESPITPQEGGIITSWNKRAEEALFVGCSCYQIRFHFVSVRSLAESRKMSWVRLEGGLALRGTRRAKRAASPQLPQAWTSLVVEGCAAEAEAAIEAT